MFDWTTDLIGRAGYVGIALLMFLESVSANAFRVGYAVGGVRRCRGELNVLGKRDEDLIQSGLPITCIVGEANRASQ